MKYTEEGFLQVRGNVLDNIYSGEADWYFTDPVSREYWDTEDPITEEDVIEYQEFMAQFREVDRSALVNEDFYKGMNYMFVVQRIEDCELFGVQYFHGGGKHGMTMFYDERDYDTDCYILKPVKPHTIQGYRYA